MSIPKTLSDLVRENGLTEKDLMLEMKEEHCCVIAIKIGKKWQTLATFIGISDTDVDDIQERYQEPQGRRLALLRKWKMFYGSEATYAKLAHGLESTGSRKLTEYLLDLLKCNLQHHCERDNSSVCSSTNSKTTLRNKKRKKKKNRRKICDKNEIIATQRNQHHSR